MGRAVFPTHNSGSDESRITQLTIAQLKAYPPEASRIDIPEATTEGYATVAVGRDGPLKLHYIVYGHGPTRIVWISGHGDGVESWYELVREFGVKNSDKGIGQSEAPWSMCSMRDLAMDTSELLDHLEWTGEKSMHIIGHSMGGMIAMQLAVLDTIRPASLTLISTTSRYLRTISPTNLLKTIVSLPLLLTADSRLAAIKAQTFGSQWLAAPDPKGTYPSNGDAWAARFINFTPHTRAALLTTPAIIGHGVDARELRTMAERLGRGRTAVVHGTDDRTIPFEAGERMWRELGGEETGVRILTFEGVRHVPHFERLEETIGLIREVVGDVQESSGQTHADIETLAGHNSVDL